ncbi:MAG: hypothetical protein QI197_04620 [Candidatus Korarchaeota archaeon]|nr:hypothetical protein [Candidatus Korarchaeota archaeon]
MRNVLVLLLLMMLVWGVPSLALPKEGFHTVLKGWCRAEGSEKGAFDVSVKPSEVYIVPPKDLMDCDLVVPEGESVEVRILQSHDYNKKSCPYLRKGRLYLEVDISGRFVLEAEENEYMQWESLPRGGSHITIGSNEECQLGSTGEAFFRIRPRGEEYVLNMPESEEYDLEFKLKGGPGEGIMGSAGVRICTVYRKEVIRMLDTLLGLFSEAKDLQKRIDELSRSEPTCNVTEIGGVRVPVVEVFKVSEHVNRECRELNKTLTDVIERLKSIPREMAVTKESWISRYKADVESELNSIQGQLGKLSLRIDELGKEVRQESDCSFYNLLITLAIPLFLLFLLILSVRRR